VVGRLTCCWIRSTRVEVALSEAHFVDRIRATAFGEAVRKVEGAEQLALWTERTGLAFPQTRWLQ
jgi:hypothetical protein